MTAWLTSLSSGTPSPGCCAAQVPDYWNAKILGLPAQTVIDDAKWLEEEFTPRVQTVSGAPEGCHLLPL